jgi:hypothetical protein
MPRKLAWVNWAVVPLGLAKSWRLSATVRPSTVRPVFSISFYFRLYFQKLLQPSKIFRKWNTTLINAKSILDESSRT